MLSKFQQRPGGPSASIYCEVFQPAGIHVLFANVRVVKAMAQVLITEDNLTPLIEIITWFFFVVAIFGILMRGVSKTFIIHRVGVDDALIFISLVSRTPIFPMIANAKGSFQKLFAVGQTIAITVSAHNGLGKPTSPPNTNSVLKVTLGVLDCARLN